MAASDSIGETLHLFPPREEQENNNHTLAGNIPQALLSLYLIHSTTIQAFVSKVWHYFTLFILRLHDECSWAFRGMHNRLCRFHRCLFQACGQCLAGWFYNIIKGDYSLLSRNRFSFIWQVLLVPVPFHYYLSWKQKV